MKKIIIYLLLIILCCIGFAGCSTNLPKGKVDEIVFFSNEGKIIKWTGGKFEYISETTIKYIDVEGNIYYFSIDSLCFIKVED